MAIDPYKLPQAGLIGTQINAANPIKSIVGYDATQRTLDPATQTVQGRVQNIINEDSPLMQQARTGALQTANERGLINSSIAAQAGQQAVINTALPIAQQDANLANDVTNRNMEAVNNAGQVTAAATNAGALQTSDSVNRESLLEKQGAIEKDIQTLRGTQQQELQKLQGSQELAVQGLRGEQALSVSNIEAGYKQLMQASDSAAKFFSQNSASISSILAEPNISPENKQALINKQIELLKSGLAVIGGISNLNLNDLLVFGA